MQVPPPPSVSRDALVVLHITRGAWVVRLRVAFCPTSSGGAPPGREVASLSTSVYGGDGRVRASFPTSSTCTAYGGVVGGPVAPPRTFHRYRLRRVRLLRGVTREVAVVWGSGRRTASTEGDVVTERDPRSRFEDEGIPDLQNGTPEQQWAEDPQEAPLPADYPVGVDEYG